MIYLSDLRGTKQLAFNIRPASTTGAPTTGTYYKGDIYIDSTGSIFHCTESGSPGTWSQIQDVSGSSSTETHAHTYQEDISGSLDGTTTEFVTANQFVADTTQVYLNGLLLRPGSSNDYTEGVGLDSITLLVTPVPDVSSGDTLVLSYIPDLE